MEKLRELRKLHKLSLKEFGALFGLAESTISLYETGKREPDLATLKKIANYFNVTVDELLGNERSNSSDYKFASILKLQRKKSGLNQSEIAEILHVSQQTIAKWENGKSEPDIRTLKQIANYFNITIDELLGVDQVALSNIEERETIYEVHDISLTNFIRMCDQLDEVTLGRIHSILISIRKLQDNTILSVVDKQHLFECITALIGRVEIYADEIRYAPEDRVFDFSKHNKRFMSGEIESLKEIISIMLPSIKPTKHKGIVIPFYETPVSAGVGSWLSDDIPTEWITLPRNDKTENADMILEIRGDSMQPRFYDGDKILVKSSESIMEGEIGVFILNGESFVKKMGKGCLISLNSAYAPIKIGRFDDIHCVGKVISSVKLN